MECLLFCTSDSAAKIDVFQNFECPQNPRIHEMLFIVQWPFVMIIMSSKCWISRGSVGQLISYDWKCYTQGLPFATMPMMASLSQAEKNYQK